MTEFGIKKAKVFFVLGAPAAGKTTQSELLAREFHLIHLSVGKLLRHEQDNNTPDGQIIKSYIDAGELVPVEIVIKLLKQEILKQPFAYYIIDGFPRNFDNWNEWQEHLSHQAHIHAVIFINCSEATLRARVLQRRHMDLTPRRDDLPAIFERRLIKFEEETCELLQYFKAYTMFENKERSAQYASREETIEEKEKTTPYFQYLEIDGEGDIDTVFHRLLPIVQSTLSDDLLHLNIRMMHTLLQQSASSATMLTEVNIPADSTTLLAENAQDDPVDFPYIVMQEEYPLLSVYELELMEDNEWLMLMTNPPMIVSYEITHPQLQLQKKPAPVNEYAAPPVVTAAAIAVEDYYYGIFQCDIRYQTPAKSSLHYLVHRTWIIQHSQWNLLDNFFQSDS